MAVQVGPFHVAEDVAEILGVGVTDLGRLVESHGVLSVETSDGERLFPVWQFTGGTVYPALRDVLHQFADVGVDGWTVAVWLTTPSVDLPGEASPRDWLLAGRDPSPVVRAAAHQAFMYRA